MNEQDTEWHKLEIGRILENGLGDKHQIVSEIHVGKNGISYKGKDIGSGAIVFIKTPKLEKKLMSNDSYIALLLPELILGFSKEAKKSARLSSIDGVVKIITTGYQTVHTVNGFPFPFPYIVHEYIQGAPLASYLKTINPNTEGGFDGLQTARQWFMLATKIIQILKDLHNQQVAHGNISPENIRVVKDEPVIVDFGESFLVDVESRKPNVNKEKDPYAAPERLTSKYWSTPADIYSIGGVLYFLATGQTPPAVETATDSGETAERSTLALKQVVYQGIKSSNPQLLKENPAVARIIDKCLRNEPGERYAYPENILSHIEIFNNEDSKNISHFSEYSQEIIRQVAKDIETLSSDAAHVQFCRILAPELLLLQKHIRGMNKGTHEIIGEREDLIDNLLRYLSLLKNGDQYFTLTIPSFWKANNLGINGRFLTMNMLMARRGVAIRRIFLLTETEKTQPELGPLFEAHQNAVEESQISAHSDSSGVPMNENEGFYTGYTIVDEEERKNVVEEGGTTGLLRFGTSGRCIAFNFATTANSETIGKVRFWSPTDANSNISKIKKYLSNSQTIQNLVGGSANLIKPEK